MAYASWSVVFGEQPSAAKWNILGTNDASFNDGSGIGTNAVAAASLATTAITLATAANITANQSFTSIGSDVAATGYSVTPTIPAGNRGVEVTAVFPQVGATGATNGTIKLWNGSVGGTLLTTNVLKLQDSGDNRPYTLVFKHTPSAGSLTYLISFSPSPNNINISASSSQVGQMWVKAV